MLNRCILLSFPLVIALAVTRIAYGVEPSSRTAYTEDYKHAHELMKTNDWVKATEAFSALWARSKTFDVAINLGQAELMLGKYREAAEHLSFGMRNAPPSYADAAAAAKDALANAKKKIGTLKISAPDGTEVFVDGKLIGTTPMTEVFVEPGIVNLNAEHAEQGSDKQAIDVAAGDEKLVVIRLGNSPLMTTEKPPKPPYATKALNDQKGPVSPPLEPEKKSGIENKTVVLIVGGAVTVIAAGTATYFGLKARSAKHDVESMIADAGREFGSRRCSSPAAEGSKLCADINSKFSERKDAAQIYNIALPIAGAAALATGIFYALLPNRQTMSAHSMTLVPIADHRTGGLILQGEF